MQKHLNYKRNQKKMSKNSEYNKQMEAFEEFLKGNWKSEDSFFHKKIVFLPFQLEKQNSQSFSFPRLAADSIAQEKKLSQSQFYISDDDDFALKIDKRGSCGDVSLMARIITTKYDKVNNCILYCPQTDKYFLINSSGEIILSGYSEFTYEKFSFELIFPLNSFRFIKESENENYLIVSRNPDFSLTDCLYTKDALVVKNKKFKEVKSAVFKSDKYHDFIMLSGDEIKVPKALLMNNFEIFVY